MQPDRVDKKADSRNKQNQDTHRGYQKVTKSILAETFSRPALPHPFRPNALPMVYHRIGPAIFRSGKEVFPGIAIGPRLGSPSKNWTTSIFPFCSFARP